MAWLYSQQKQPMELDGFGTHGYMLYSLGSTVSIKIRQNQEKDLGGFGGFGRVRVNDEANEGY